MLTQNRLFAPQASFSAIAIIRLLRLMGHSAGAGHIYRRDGLQTSGKFCKYGPKQYRFCVRMRTLRSILDLPTVTVKPIQQFSGFSNFRLTFFIPCDCVPVWLQSERNRPAPYRCWVTGSLGYRVRSFRITGQLWRPGSKSAPLGWWQKYRCPNLPRPDSLVKKNFRRWEWGGDGLSDRLPYDFVASVPSR